MLTKEKSLRVGITIENDEAPFWVNEIAEAIGAIPSIQLIKVSLTGVRKSEPGIFFRLFAKIDHRLLPGKLSIHSRAKHDLSSNSITLNLRSDNDDLRKLAKANLDILFHFVDCPLSDSILNASHLGTYALQFGDANLPLAYVGFAEWFAQQPVTSVKIIQVKEGQNFNQLISESITKTDFLSLSRNQTAIFSSAVDLVLTTLHRLSNSPHSISTREQKINSKHPPGFVAIVAAFFRLGSRLVNKALNKFFFIEQWVLLYGDAQKIHSVDIKNFKPIIPPKDRFWADPFIVSQGNKNYLFIEELPYQTNKGHLSCLVTDRQGKIEASQKIIETPYHLSYPFIFSYEGKWFLIPESAENKTVDLYECVSFPFEWRWRRTLLEDIKAYDSTLHFFNNRVWLFCTVQRSEGGSPNDRLHLYSIENLLEGKFVPHPMNPIISDPYHARPAGKIFQHNGNWYRPSQVCVPRYGYALAFNRIDVLNENEYQETLISQNLPEEHPFLKSMHTYNSDGGFTIIDGQIKRFRFLN
ncbi:MAG TPA: hypothetical protein DGG95_11245 [Cytophagales bacterium]|jgi:hypothetical protein|nr:hypothetical protein [Cytophagales bacterium]